MRVPGIPFVPGRNAYTDGDGKKYAIAIHNTSNDATDEQESAYARNRRDGVSAHFYCDNDTIIQSLDTNARAGHAGSKEGNENAIAVEITGVNGWTRDQWLKNVAWGPLGKTLAYVCRYYGIPIARPSVQVMHDRPTVKGFYSHDDMRRAWGGTTHTDPGPAFPWDKLFASVNIALNPAPPKPEVIGDMRDVVIAREEKTREVFVGNGIVRRHVRTELEREGLQYWVGKRGGDPTVHIFKSGTIGVLGVDVTDEPPVVAP